MTDAVRPPPVTPANRGLIIALGAVAVSVLIAAFIIVEAIQKPATVTTATAVPPTSQAPAAQSSASSSSTSAPSSNTTSTSGSNAGLPAAVAAVQGQGFTATDTSLWTDGHKLNAIKGRPSGAASDQLSQWFFFADGNFVGIDSLVAHQSPGVIDATTDVTITIKYGIFTATDPLCCPTGGDQFVTYTWDGTLTATGISSPTRVTTTPSIARGGGIGTYHITHDTTVNEGSNTESRTLHELPSGTEVRVECTVVGETVTDIWGPDSYWDWVVVGEVQGYVTDEWLDTRDDIKDRSKIPLCNDGSKD